MTRLRIINARIVLSDRIVEGELCIDGGKIAGIDIPFDAELTIDAAGNYVAPGFIDIHTHGGFGHDYLDGTEEAFLEVPRRVLEYGTTSLVPTLASADHDEMEDAIRAYERSKHKTGRGASILGIHLEGPYFSLEKAGAQDPRFIKNPTRADYCKFLEESDDIIRWSAAPELPGAIEFARDIVREGILPAIAHTSATYEQILPAFDAGFTLMTHMYCAMSGITKVNSVRYAGAIESAFLIDGMDIEMIADGRHLPGSLLKFVTKFKTADQIAVCTDSMRGAGSKEGEHVILGSLKNGFEVVIEDQVAKVLDRSHCAGSVCTTDRLVRNMVTLAGSSIVDAVKMATTVPARLSKAFKKGEIAPGKDADLVIFDDDINVQKTIIGGRVVFSKTQSL